ncbi:hypothetical protein [Actinomycetospora sp.]|jgi:hypothetical protein|uniref:hypothetical protein n=1 Tax=Actinomycetospora sp. TaxID=1872135 RepID=UPI002F3F04A2
MCLEKPAELVALYDETPPMFTAIRELFGVPDTPSLDVSSVDRRTDTGEDLGVTAVLALHYIQSLRYLAKPGVRARILTIVNTSACLHSVLSTLADGCGHRAEANRIWQARDRIAVAASAIAAADLSHGGGNTYMR